MSNGNRFELIREEIEHKISLKHWIRVLTVVVFMLFTISVGTYLVSNNSFKDYNLSYFENRDELKSFSKKQIPIHANQKTQIDGIKDIYDLEYTFANLNTLALENKRISDLNSIQNNSVYSGDKTKKLSNSSELLNTYYSQYKVHSQAYINHTSCAIDLDYQQQQNFREIVDLTKQIPINQSDLKKVKDSIVSIIDLLNKNKTLIDENAVSCMNVPHDDVRIVNTQSFYDDLITNFKNLNQGIDDTNESAVAVSINGLNKVSQAEGVLNELNRILSGKLEKEKLSNKAMKDKFNNELSKLKKDLESYKTTYFLN